jgi:hypothetical protein
MTLDLRSREASRHGRIATTGMWGRVRYLIVAAGASLEARRMLARVLRPYRSRGSPTIPAYILRDIGLPEDYFERRPSHWDHQ